MNWYSKFTGVMLRCQLPVNHRQWLSKRFHLHHCSRQECTGSQQVPQDLIIQAVGTCEQMRQVADMRAEAFYENSHFDRFISTYKRQFSDIEYERLTKMLPAEPRSVVGTFVAVEQPTPEGKILGCMDILKASSDQQETSRDLTGWYYIKNVVVEPSSRRQGIGRQMLLTAEEMIRSSIACDSSDTTPSGDVGIFVHVELSNVDALSLYTSLGYSREDAMAETSEPIVSVGVVALLSKTIAYL